jgi:indole-3-glycerol phosphate synthase
MTLEAILKVTRERVAALHDGEADLAEQAKRAGKPWPFLASRGPAVGVIAEIKRRSPSQGSIQPELDPVEYARAYERGGAAAISVLTEEVHFGGSLRDLSRAAGVVGIPALRKDFIIDEMQVLEALANGASAILLIVRILADEQLRHLSRAAALLGMGRLIEVHHEAELERALAAEPTAIGVNARDLDTLRIDAAAAERLLRRIPADIVAVAESGIERKTDVERVAAAGADFVLVGTSVARQSDPEQAVRALMGVKREAR